MAYSLRTGILILFAIASGGYLVAAASGDAERSVSSRRTTEITMADQPKPWPTPIPDDCPLPRSAYLKGIRLTGRHAAYTVTD